jgi:hypothetical protein
MKSGESIRLRRDDVIRLYGENAGKVISCREGVLWLTQTGNPGDHLIHAGEAFSTGRPGRILIGALEDSLFVISVRASEAASFSWSFMPAILRMAHRIKVVRKSLWT